MAFRTNKTPVLQTKSASGSVATFNTALAMPLPSCNIAVTATQSGSGTPSPDNVRTINGYSAINISHSDADTSNPTVYTIQIGSTVYGGEYDARTGVLTANVKTRVFNGAVSEDWGDYPSGNGYSFSSIVDMQSIVLYDGLCNWLKVRTTVDNTDTNAIYIGVGNRNIYAVGVKDIFPTLADWRTYLSNNNLIITYPLATPTTIQLPPCPIDTIANSVNNIWADTGNVDLTYKDLDIAKRGNFREVFRLPS